MRIPLNIINYYLSFPVILYLALRGWFVVKNKLSIVNQYITWAASVYSLALLSYIVPVLFTSDSHVLTLSIITGDWLQFTAVLFIWLLATHLVFKNKQPYKSIANLIAVGITLTSGFVSLQENLAHPTQLMISQGQATLSFASTPIYNLWNGIDNLCLLIVGVYFLIQVRSAVGIVQRLRLISLGGFFLLIGIVIIGVVGFNAKFDSPIVSLALLIPALILTVLSIITHFISKRQPSPSTR